MDATTGGESARDGSEPLAYTLQEFAAMFKLSYRKVRYMADNGELPITYFGRARRVLAADIEQYVRELQQQGQQAS